MYTQCYVSNIANDKDKNLPSLINIFKESQLIITLQLQT